MEPELTEVLAEYGLGPPSAVSRVEDGVWLLDCGGQSLVLREMKRHRARAAFTLQALAHLVERDFGGLPPLRPDKNGRLGVSTGRSTWLLSELVRGRGAIFGLNTDAVVTAAALGSMHRAAAGLRLDGGSGAADTYDRYVLRCRDRVRSLHTYVVMAEHKLRRTAMDEEYLAAVATMLPLAETTLKRLESCGWADLAREAGRQGTFVYRRVGGGGILITDDACPRAVFVDWSGCRPDCHVTDVGRLVGRVIKGSGGDDALVREAVAAYEHERPMSPEERAILPLMLLFPDRFYELARRYYEHKRDWPENTFVRHLRRVMQNHQAQLACVREWTTH